ncbi:14387_t:CDS:2, partial [Ambispora leptoticha]
PFDRKIDAYLKDLEIIDMGRGKRQQKASQLLDRYRKASKNFPLQWWRDNRRPDRSFVIQGCSLSHKPVLEHKPDRNIAKSWEKERTRKQVHLHQRIRTVNGVNGTVNGGKVEANSNPLLRRTPRKINRINYAENSKRVNNTSKRTHEEVYDDEYDEIDDYDESDDENEDEDVNKDDDYDDENEGEDVDEDVDKDIDEDDDEDIDEDVDEDDNKDKKAKEKMKLEKKLIDNFVSRFKAINADNKWKLPSGRFVEDVLYDWAVAHHSETLAHSFILDTDCQEVMDLFSPEEKETILNTSKKSFPAVQDDIKKYVMKYYKKNVSDLRQIVMEPYLKNMETYNPKLHYDLEWIHLVFNKFVIEWEQGVNALADDNLEAWIVSHVWTFIVDMALKDIEETKIGNSREILAGEVTRTGDIHDRKYLGDRMKLLKLMKDMFDLIIESLPPTTIENYESLCTFGIQLFKNKGAIYIMDRPGGVIARLTKKAQLEAPIYIEGICELILSIVTMLELKNAIREIIHIIEKIESDELEAQVFQRNNTGPRLPLAGTSLVNN